MTTVSPGGRPQTSPVWFLLDGGEILVYSLADTARVRNIAANPQVALNLDGDGRGGDIVTIEGTATVDDSIPPADQHGPYMDKYAASIAANGWTPPGFAADYPVPIRIQATRERAW